MTRRSKREIERALEKLFGGHGGAPERPEQYEIVITETIHETGYSADAETPVEKPAETSVEKSLVWGEIGGEVHSKKLDVDVGEEEDCAPEA